MECECSIYCWYLFSYLFGKLLVSFILPFHFFSVRPFTIMGDTEKEPINTDQLDGPTNQVIPEITVTQIPEPVPKKTKVDPHLLWTLLSNNDIHKLPLFGLKYGFITNQLRQKIYPILLKFDIIPELKPAQKLSDLALHQLECDCNRSFSNFGFSVEKLTLLRTQLLETLVYLLTRCPYLHYYQGFHSIASIFILMLVSCI